LVGSFFSHLNESTFRITGDWNLLGGRSDVGGSIGPGCEWPTGLWLRDISV